MEKESVPNAPPPGFIPPPSYSMGPPPAPPTSNVIIVPTAFGPEPQRLVCPNCRSDILTSVETESNTKTHLFALLLCVLGCWICAPCPYCMDTCLVKKHYCPGCQTYLGQCNN